MNDDGGDDDGYEDGGMIPMGIKYFQMVLLMV